MYYCMHLLNLFQHYEQPNILLCLNVLQEIGMEEKIKTGLKWIFQQQNKNIKFSSKNSFLSILLNSYGNPQSFQRTFAISFVSKQTKLFCDGISTFFICAIIFVFFFYFAIASRELCLCENACLIFFFAAF